MTIQASEQIKHIGDALSIGTVLATIAGWLPAIAALLTIVWTGIRIWETNTVQGWLHPKQPERRDEKKTGWPGDEA